MGVTTPGVDPVAAPFTITADNPVCLHLNNLHSSQQYGAPKLLTVSLPKIEDFEDTYRIEYYDGGSWTTTELMHTAEQNRQRAQDQQKQSGIQYDLDAIGGFASNMVTQPRQSAWNTTTKTTPVPDGNKIKLHSVDLTFKIDGYMKDTTFDFFFVQEKKCTQVYDPWDSKTKNMDGIVKVVSARGKHLPYTLNEFLNVTERMDPYKIDRKRYNVLQHQRCYINNAYSRPEGEGPETLASMYATGGIQDTNREDVYRSLPHLRGPPMVPTTKHPTKYVHMRYAPHAEQYRLKSSIPEGADPSRYVERALNANQFENQTFGSMSYDNFDPKRNVWLVITTDFKPPALAASDPTNVLIPQISLLRKVSWQDHIGAKDRGVRTVQEGNPYGPNVPFNPTPEPGENTQQKKQRTGEPKDNTTITEKAAEAQTYMNMINTSLQAIKNGLGITEEAEERAKIQAWHVFRNQILKYIKSYGTGANRHPAHGGAQAGAFGDTVMLPADDL